MPDRIDKTFEAIQEPWLSGPRFGARYVRILEAALAKSKERAQINQALSLGAYLLHTQSNKRVRHATRAYLLAEFLMQAAPLDSRNALRANCRGWPLAKLIRAFRSCFLPYRTLSAGTQLILLRRLRHRNFHQLHTLTVIQLGQDPPVDLGERAPIK